MKTKMAFLIYLLLNEIFDANKKFLHHYLLVPLKVQRTKIMIRDLIKNFAKAKDTLCKAADTQHLN